MDIMDIGTSVENMRYGLVAIDNFTKIAHVVEIQNKKPPEVIRAVKEVFSKIGIPKQVYSDEEGSFFFSRCSCTHGRTARQVACYSSVEPPVAQAWGSAFPF